MKKICIAIDYNIHAAQITDAGYAQAKAFNAEVIIIHVFNDAMLYNSDESTPFGFSHVSYDQEIQFGNLSKLNMEKYLATSKKYLNDESIQTQLLEGNPEDEILKFVKTWNADLLVIGKHKHNAIDSILLGDTAVKIIKHAKIPILLIPVKKE